MNHPNHLTAALALLLSLTLAAGCSSTSQGEKMVQSFSRTREQVSETQRQIDAALRALEALRHTQGDALKEAFGDYKDEVNDLEKEGASAKWRATTMKQEQEAHIQAWQEEMKNIKDPTIKSTLESRQQAVRSNFTIVQMYTDDVRKRFEPFLSGNKQLVQALSIDLSPAAVSSLNPVIDRVMSDGGALKERLAAMQQALTNITNGVSPLGE